MMVIAIMALQSCSIKREYDLAKFSFNQRKFDSLIKNRIPDYGDGHSDGCIVMPEMNLVMKDSTVHLLSGTVKDVNTSRPLTAVHVVVQYADSTVTEFYTDKNGEFSLSKGNPVSEMRIDHLGYRGLQIQIGRRKLF